MIKTVLKYVFSGLVIILIFAWLLGGGLSQIKTAAGTNVGHPLAYMITHPIIMLPWQPGIPQGPDLSNMANDQSSATTNSNASEATTYGNTSPYGNSLSISPDGATGSTPQTEYVVLQNNSSQTIDVTGWSVQSAITGARAYIPRAANFFVQGALNNQTDINLAPGGVVILSTGDSPVGTSLRENECSGYLGEMQPFTPALTSSCPDDSAGAANYGPACASYAASISACTFPRSAPQNLPSGCAAYLQNTLSYNGCVQAHQTDPSFASNTWRAYFNATRKLWSNTSDTIRLLDGNGQVVAATNY